MSWISDLGKIICQITHIEKLGIFCFTVISVISLIKNDPYSLPIIFYSLGLVTYFTYLGFFREELKESRIDRDHPEITIETYSSGFRFTHQNDMQT